MSKNPQGICPKCMEDSYDEERLNKSIEEYVTSLDEELKAEDTEYRRRLRFCAACECRMGITCSQCGCFIQARAAKKRMHCPYPAGQKW